MPKIIENLENRLVAECKKQIDESGYGAVTIRSIAKSCGVGVGTVYNYFPSKEALLASYMLKDWKQCIAAINAVSSCSREPEPVVRCIFDQLIAFSRKHETLFRDEAAAAVFAGSSNRYHRLLRSQLAEPLQRFCPNAFTAEFIAEALLTWTTAGKAYGDIYGIIEKLL